MRTLLLIPVLLMLSGCLSTPEFPKADLRINEMPDIEAQRVEPLKVPTKPKGKRETVTTENGGTRKVQAFTADELKRLLQIVNAAEGNAALVEEMNSLIQLYAQRANMMKDLAALEEARAARLEADLEYADYQMRQQKLESKIETWSWKIVAILGLVVGL